MAAVFSKTTKQMLKNVIRHTNSHNKTVEETEMWQQHERMKELGGLDPSNPSFGHDDRCTVRNDRDRRRNDYWNSRSEKRAYLSTSYRSRRAHMDEEEEKGRAGISTSTYWMRQLEKLESSDPNRWDHSGYRELYPQDFDSDRSDSESCRQVFHRHRGDRTSTTKKKKKHHSRSKKRRQKEKKSTHRHRKQVRRRKLSSPSDDSESESDSSSSDTASSPHEKQHIPRQQHREKAKSNRHPSSESSSESYSDSDSRDRSLDRRPKQGKRTGNSSVPKAHRYNKTKPSRCTSSSSSSSDSGSDSYSRARSQCDRKPRKRTRHSSVSMSSTDRSDSSSSPARKKAKPLKSRRKDTSKSQKRSKHKSQNIRNGGVSRQAGRQEAENQVVVKMLKEANGYSGSSRNTDFDRPLQQEIASQYRGLKQEYAHKNYSQKPKLNGRSSLKPKRRKRYSSSSSSSDS